MLQITILVYDTCIFKLKAVADCCRYRATCSKLELQIVKVAAMFQMLSCFAIINKVKYMVTFYIADQFSMCLQVSNRMLWLVEKDKCTFMQENMNLVKF